MNSNIRFSGSIFIPGGYTTQWPSKSTTKKGKTANDDSVLPRLDGEAFIPFPQIKAGLRRAAVQAIVTASGQKLKNVDRYYFNMVGGIKAEKEEGANHDASLTMLEAVRQRNPVVGLFGSGDVLGTMAAGRIFGKHGMVNPNTVSYGSYGGVRSDDARRAPDLMQMLIDGDTLDEDVAKLHQKNAHRTAKKKEIQKLRRDLKNMADEEKKAQFEKIQKIEEEIKGVAASTLLSFPYVLTDCFSTGMTLVGVTQIELGMLLAAMQNQAQCNPYLGAHKSSGFGEFSAHWVLEGDTFGRVEQIPFVGIQIEGDMLQEAYDVFMDAATHGRFDLNQEG